MCFAKANNEKMSVSPARPTHLHLRDPTFLLFIYYYLFILEEGIPRQLKHVSDEIRNNGDIEKTKET